MKPDLSTSRSFSIAQNRLSSGAIQNLADAEVQESVDWMREMIKRYQGVLDEFEEELQIRIDRRKNSLPEVFQSDS